MVLINSSKIFISIRRPHATCIINAQPKDTTTTFPTYRVPSADLPRTHSGPPVRVCKWKWMSVTPQGGQRSAEMHSGTSLRRLRSRCVAPPSRRSPRACLCWGNTILSFRLSAASEGGRVTFPVPLCLSMPAGSLPTLRLYRGRTQPETQDEIQGESLQILSFVKMAFTSDLSE